MRGGDSSTVAASFLRRWWPVAAVAALLALASVAAAHSSLEINRVEPPVQGLPPAMPEYLPPSEEPAFPPTPQEVAPADPTQIPTWLTRTAAGICIAITLALIIVPIWRLVRDLVRRRGGRMPPEPAVRSSEQTAEEVVAALDAGLVDLSASDSDPRRAVIACWVRLEQAAAVAGIPRNVGDTPTDLVTRLLSARSGVSADVLAPFAEVFREARYATHTVDERMRGQARYALRRLRGELTAEISPE